MAEILLNKGRIAIVDDCDYEHINRWKWFVSAKGYAVRSHSPKGRNGKRVLVTMHRVIIGTPDGMETDHINGDKLDNRRANLRICTTSQNQGNVGLRKDNTSGFKGVYWRKDRKKWHALITVAGKRKHLGFFDTPESAYEVYCRAADEFHGEFANYGR